MPKFCSRIAITITDDIDAESGNSAVNIWSLPLLAAAIEYKYFQLSPDFEWRSLAEQS